MALPNNARNRLADEGLVTVNDFADFKEDELKAAIKNLRVPIAGVPEVLDAAGNVVNAAIPAVPPCLISSKCSLRLKVASVAFHYYTDIGREPTSANMNYTHVLKNFYVEWEAIQTLIEEDKPSVPVLSKNVPPLKWLESFRDCMLRTYGVRGCPVSYIIRESPGVQTEAEDPLSTNAAGHVLPYGTSGSVLEEMIKRFSHTHPLYKSDNAMVYSMLETATRGTVYASTIKSYSRTKNGRNAWLAMISSHAGQDKWEKLQKEKMDFLSNVKWNGRSYSLDKFCTLHRSAYVALEEAAIHVNFQLPTEHTRVGHLIDNITHNDPDLRAAIASIRINTDNMRSDFEGAVTALLPVDPYIKSRAKKGGAEISDVTLKGISQSKTGVDLRWHTKEEYSKLNSEQRQELYKWQQTKDGKAAIEKSKRKESGSESKQKKRLKSQVSSLSKKIDGLASKLQKQQTDESELANIAAAIAAHAPSGDPKSKGNGQAKKVAFVTGDEPYKAAALAVHKIIRRDDKSQE